MLVDVNSRRDFKIGQGLTSEKPTSRTRLKLCKGLGTAAPLAILVFYFL